MSLLEYALKNNRMDLAAHILVYGLLKAAIKYNGKKRRTKRQPERS